MKVFRVREFQENGEINAGAVGEINSVYWKKSKEDKVSEEQYYRREDQRVCGRETKMGREMGIIRKDRM